MLALAALESAMGEQSGGWKQPVCSLVQMLLGAFCIRQMANQVAVQLINVYAPQIVELLALMAENGGTRNHGDIDAFAVEYVAVHDRSPGAGLRDKGCACWQSKARQIVRAVCHFPLPPQLTALEPAPNFRAIAQKSHAATPGIILLP
jgi:hypothetical protein